MQQDYFKVINVKNCSKIIIGNADDADIVIYNSNVDNLILERKHHDLIITAVPTNVNILINGKQIMPNQKIKVYQFLTIDQYTFYYKDDCLFTSKAFNISSQLDNRILQVYDTAFEYPNFHLNTRLKYRYCPKKIELHGQRDVPEKEKRRWWIAIVPTALMFVVFLNINQKDNTFIYFSILSMSATVIVTILTSIFESIDYKKKRRERDVAYEKYLQNQKLLIEEERQIERTINRLTHLCTKEQLELVKNFSPRLFEKSKKDDDFLMLYLGKGTVNSINPINIHNADHNSEIEQIKKAYEKIDDMAIILDLNKFSNAGIYGRNLTILLNNLTLDIATKYCHNDVKIMYLLNEETADKLKWIRWLPNVKSNDYSHYFIAFNLESSKNLLEYIYQLFVQRENLKVFDTYYIVFVENIDLIRLHPINYFLKYPKQYGIYFIFLNQYKENLPFGCQALIEIINNKKGLLIDTNRGSEHIKFTFLTVDKNTLNRVAIKLAPIKIDTIHSNLILPDTVTIFDVLNIQSITELNLQQRWDENIVYQSLRAPVGIDTKRQIIYLDISDNKDAHGPHGLVAGTTGSGKSELLQSYILSMSTLYHPHEVGFVLIDFKGGGMANQFKNLPHILGVITNIDGREINRFLLSMKSEIIKRQQIFSIAQVNHINDYIKLYKNKKVVDPLPHLIMIIDEFAELKMEYPDFMKELISMSRIGRTLGVHLILSTQKPSGVIDAQIWANSKFKLCLKVQTKEDSIEVLKVPLACEIVKPGRAYLQVGNNEIFELFQSAYSSSYVLDHHQNAKKFSIYERNLWGEKILKYTNDTFEKSSLSNQLEEIVNYISYFCQRMAISKLNNICLPSLKKVIDVKELNNTHRFFNIPIGIFDNPSKQKQDSYYLNLLSQNTFIVGSSGKGKTTLLQTLLFHIVTTYTAQEISLYIIDCDKLVLKIYEQANQVGGFITIQDSEKCKNLVKLLQKIFDERKMHFSKYYVSTYQAYLDLNIEKLPLVVVVIDNLEIFKEYFEIEFEKLINLFREGSSVGIHFVITAMQSSTLPFRLHAQFSEKIVLNCIDASEYITLVNSYQLTPKQVVGRGLCIHDKDIVELQIAIVKASLKEVERNQYICQKIKLNNEKYKSKSQVIPCVPNQLIYNSLEFENKINCIPIGMNFDTVSIEYISFEEQLYLALCGDSKYRTTFLEILLQSCVRHYKILLIDDGTLKQYQFQVDKYVTSFNEGKEVVDQLIQGMPRQSNNYFILIIHHEELLKLYQKDQEESQRLLHFIQEHQKIFVILSGIPNQKINYMSSPLMCYIKEESQVLVFMRMSSIRLFELPNTIEKNQLHDTSIVYYFTLNDIHKIKLFNL